MTAIPAQDLPGPDAGYSALQQDVLDALEFARVAAGGAPGADAIVACAPAGIRHQVVGLLAGLAARGRVETFSGRCPTRYRDVFVSRGRWEVAL